MQQLTTTRNGQALTMSSREIAQVVESRHDKVKQSIERLADRGLVSFAEVGEKSSTGRPGTVYHVNKRDSYVVVAQLSPAHIGKVVDAWGRTEHTLEELISALNAFDVPEECAGMYVYAIREAETARIKLGISRNPEARLRQLQTANSQRLDLIAYRKAGGGFSDEAAVHVLNRSEHLRGEWFGPQASLEGPVGKSEIVGGVA